MDNNFDKCLAFVLKEEGGNDDDPNDHGGRTSRGITQREWDKFRITHPDRNADVWKASDEDIKEIYHSGYWLPHCSNLPAGLDLVFFDFGVNAGMGQAIKKLQIAVGVPADGAWGPQTEAAVKSIPADKVWIVVENYTHAREAFYRGLAQYSRYGKGWSARNERCNREAHLMIRPDTTFSSPRANPVDVKTKAGPAATVVIAGTAGAAVAAQQGHSPLIFLGIIAAAVVVGVIIHYFVNRKVN